MRNFRRALILISVGLVVAAAGRLIAIRGFCRLFPILLIPYLIPEGSPRANAVRDRGRGFAGSAKHDVTERRAARMVARMGDAAVRVIDGPQGHAAAPVAAMIGYPIPEATEPGPDLPPAFLPLMELENLSAASWYINALGVQPEARGRGLGARLLAEADALARAAGLDAVSLIASDVNVGAIRLYERNGFEVVASRPKVGFEGWTPEGRGITYDLEALRHLHDLSYVVEPEDDDPHVDDAEFFFWLFEK